MPKSETRNIVLDMSDRKLRGTNFFASTWSASHICIFGSDNIVQRLYSSDVMVSTVDKHRMTTW
jgi:hypothetical protein